MASPSEIAAYVGAAAWLPQIAKWVWNRFEKPSLDIVSAPSVEIGYTTFGPIVNFTVAVSSERRDALIVKMTATLVHEAGDQHHLTWRFLNERMQQIRSPAGETSEVTKNQPAVALRVSTLQLTEKLIGFQDPEFLTQGQSYTAEIESQYTHLRQEGGDPLNSLLRSREFTTAQQHFRDSMFWRTGAYTLSVNLHEVRLKEPFSKMFSFNLTSSQVEKLRANAELLESAMRQRFHEGAGNPPDVFWNWVYPEIAAV
jgi:hypothetical protein